MNVGTFKNIRDRLCQHCGKEFKNIGGSIFANHVRWCDKNLYRDIELEKEHFRKNVNITNNRIHGIKQYYIVCCFKCNQYYVIEKRELSFLKKYKFFCSRTCANTRPHSKEDKLKIKNSICKNGQSLSEYIKQLWKDPDYSKRVLNHNKCFTSKGERELRDWFINTFQNEEWTYGGSLTYMNVNGIVRDLYSKKLKVCVEYDGEWHFKELIGQLQSKQMKDQALESWCIENGWRLIRIKDEIYQSDPLQWKNKIREEILKGTNQVVKYYN